MNKFIIILIGLLIVIVPTMIFYNETHDSTVEIPGEENNLTHYKVWFGHPEGRFNDKLLAVGQRLKSYTMYIEYINETWMRAVAPMQEFCENKDMSPNENFGDSYEFICIDKHGEIHEYLTSTDNSTKIWTIGEEQYNTTFEYMDVSWDSSGSYYK